MRAFVLAVTLVTVAARGYAVPITSCGDSVPPGETGDLMNDLTCNDPATAGRFAAAVYLGNGSTLNLNGFHITGDGQGIVPGPGGDHDGIYCGSLGSTLTFSCTINGPGEVTNFGGGIAAEGHLKHMTVSNVTVGGNRTGLWGGFGMLSATNVVADNNTEYGVVGEKIVATNIEANNNGETGLEASRARVTGLTATGNGRLGGVSQVDHPRALVLTNSNVTGNDGLGQGFDILWAARVKLVGTVCGRSARLGPFGVVAGTYHVCTND